MNSSESSRSHILGFAMEGTRLDDTKGSFVLQSVIDDPVIARTTRSKAVVSLLMLGGAIGYHRHPPFPPYGES